MADSFADFIDQLSQSANDGLYIAEATSKMEPASKKARLNDDLGKPDLGFIDVKKLEYAARSLQKSLGSIVNDSPTYHELQEIMSSKEVEESTRFDLRHNRLLQLATKVKSKYVSEESELIDSIIEDSLEVSEDKKQEEHGSVSLPQEVEGEVEIVSRKTPTGSFPKLPEIRNPDLYQKAFIHKSTINNKSYLSPSELINSHNERLEFLGDSILNNLVTLIIYERFPDASEGELSKMRSSLINNSVLTEFSIQYGFDKKLRSNINESILRQGKQKIYADIFEAYIGALSLESEMGFKDIKEWLAQLMEPKLKKFDKEIEQFEPINKEAKSELYSLIGTAQFHPTYETVRHGDGATTSFIIRCMMKDDVLGEGVAPGHKDAGLRAAMAALKNKEMLEKYGQYRSSLDRTETVISNKAKSPVTTSHRQSTPSPSYMLSLPLVADENQPLQADAKNTLYALVGKRMGEVPEYNTTETEDKKVRSEIIINGVTVAIGLDYSKKKSMTRAAMVILDNQDILDNFMRKEQTTSPQT